MTATTAAVSTPAERDVPDVDGDVQRGPSSGVEHGKAGKGLGFEGEEHVGYPDGRPGSEQEGGGCVHRPEHDGGQRDGPRARWPGATNATV